MEEWAAHPDTGLPGKEFRLVPFESVGGSGVLPAFRPDQVLRLPEKTPIPCYIALWDHQFPPGGFQALYGPDQFPQHLGFLLFCQRGRERFRAVDVVAALGFRWDEEPNEPVK